MANISILTRLINGVVRNVDLSTNTLVVQSLNTGVNTLTDTILGNLVSLQNGTTNVGAALHAHDGLYNRASALASSTSGSAGSTLIGDDNSYTHFTPGSATVKGALSAIDAVLGSATTAVDSTFRIVNSVDATKKIAFSANGISTGTVRTLTMPDANVDLGNLTNTNISPTAAIAYSKLSLAGAIVNADISTSAAIAYAKLALSGSIVNADIAAGAAIALNKLAALTASRALVSDASGIVSTSAVTSTELGYLSGVTSSVQTQLDAKVASSTVGQPLGVASLDSGGKVPVSQLPNSIMEYVGVWDASTNTPTLTNYASATAAGTHIGDVYRVSVAGTVDFGAGAISFSVGDYAILNNSGIWEKSHSGSDAVLSVNGASGIVTVNAINQLTGDVTTSAASGSQSLAATIAAGAVTALKLGTVTDGVTLDQGGTGSTIEVKAGGISNTQISATAAIAYSKLSLTGSIVNADVSASAAIAYSKLALSASIVNADISASAAIAYSKLALTNSIVAGDLTSSSVTTAKIAAAAVDNTKLASNVFDQSTITSSSGVAAAVQSAPALKMQAVAGQIFSALNTTFAVRWGIPSNSETATQIYPADITTSSFDLFYVIGTISVGGSSIAQGATVTVTKLGSVTTGSSDPVFTSTNVGKPLFLGSGGVITATPTTTTGQALVRLGMLSSTTTLDVNPMPIAVN